MNVALNTLHRIYDLGGPVVLILLATSIVTLAVILYKTWQFAVSGVGRHRALSEALNAWDSGERLHALNALGNSKSYLTPVVHMAFDTQQTPSIERLEAEAEIRFAKLETGLRFLDTVAQLAPLMGLFGTVLGMISAFQSLQEAGAQVDPSILAGGIWVALLTTAVGLVVAMPTAVVLSWLEGRMQAERTFAARAIHTAISPRGTRQTSAAPIDPVFSHA